MIRVFLSYAHEDLEAARRLYHELNSYPAVDVWFDKESLSPGQRWEEAIRRAIRDSRYFLLLLSRSSTVKKGFYQKEVRLALEVLEEYPDDEIFLVPVRLDECEPHIGRLNALQYVDLFPDWNSGVARIVRGLQLHARSPQTEVQPEGGTSTALRFTSHQARFFKSPRMFYFINVT